MKNTKTLLIGVASILAATSCAPTTPSTPSTTTSEPSTPVVLDLETTLNELKEGVKISSTTLEKNGTEETTYNIQTASKEKEFSVIIFEDETRTEKDLHEYYVGKDGDDYVYTTRLNVNNEYTYYKTYNPFAAEYYKWEDGFDNVFKTLTLESFNKIDDYSYSLKEELLETTSAGYSTLLYGNPGLELTSLTLSLEEGVLTLESTLSYQETYTLSSTSIVLEKGNAVSMDYRSLPFEEIEDETWENMLTSLKANNYTATVENYDEDILDNVSKFYSEEDKVYWETGEYKSGFYALDDGTIQEVTKQDDKFYKVGEATDEATLDEFRPSLEIARPCFNLEGGVYTLKAGVEGDTGVLTIFEAYADELDEFTLTITEDSYVFTNVLGSYKTVITFENVGTTSCGFDEETVLEPLAAATWEDVLELEAFETLLSYIGDEAYNIPAPEGYIGWVFIYEETCAYVTVEAKETLDDDIYAYASALMDAGYTTNGEECGLLIGGIMFEKDITVNGTEQHFIIEVGTLYGMFVVGFYFI